MIQCNNNICNGCDTQIGADCVLITTDCNQLCFSNNCNDTTLEYFISQLCIKLLTIKNELNCLEQFCNTSCNLNTNSITVTL